MIVGSCPSLAIQCHRVLSISCLLRICSSEQPIRCWDLIPFVVDQVKNGDQILQDHRYDTCLTSYLSSLLLSPPLTTSCLLSPLLTSSHLLSPHIFTYLLLSLSLSLFLSLPLPLYICLSFFLSISENPSSLFSVSTSLSPSLPVSSCLSSFLPVSSPFPFPTLTPTHPLSHPQSHPQFHPQSHSHLIHSMYFIKIFDYSLKLFPHCPPLLS